MTDRTAPTGDLTHPAKALREDVQMTLRISGRISGRLSGRSSIRAAAIALLAGLAAPAFAQTPASAANTPDPNHPGKAIYDSTCAACHNNPGATRAAPFATLIGSNPSRLREVLSEGGVMAPMAASLSPADLNNLIGYLTSGQKAAAADWTDAMMCAADKRTVDVTKPVAFSGFSVDPKSSRNLTAQQAGLKKSAMKDLAIAWGIGFPQTQGAGTGAAVLGDTLFIAGGNRVLALDAASGCAKWVYKSGSRNTPTIADIDGRKALLFSSGKDIHAVDAKTGELIWKANGQPANGMGATRGAVVVYKDKIIVPISASGVAAGMNPKFECCEGHGAVVALSAKDGAKLWEYNTMPDATYTGAVNSAGVKQKGPSGAPIWSVPTIDAKRNRVIVTTGENTSHPGTDTSDAIIALDLDTGKEVWKFQAMSSDVWNMSCSTTKEASGANCPWHFEEGAGIGRDFDFGAQAIIATGKGGKDVVLAGQKSGHVWALDAETGAKLWEQRIGEGTALGGVHWGIATDGTRVFAPINDPFPGAEGGPAHPGIYAFDIKTGKKVWGYDAKPDCEGPRGKLVAACTMKYGFSAAPIVIDGALVAGTLDGKLFVFDSKTGKILNTIDTVGPQATNNGIEGKGGSIESHGVSAGNGMIFVDSGYGSFGQTAGNVLLALKPKSK
jgi:polyvinyl alcohol dehydrogenase (cytochrome)